MPHPLNSFILGVDMAAILIFVLAITARKIEEGNLGMIRCIQGLQVGAWAAAYLAAHFTAMGTFLAIPDSTEIPGLRRISRMTKPLSHPYVINSLTLGAPLLYIVCVMPMAVLSQIHLNRAMELLPLTVAPIAFIALYNPTSTIPDQVQVECRVLWGELIQSQHYFAISFAIWLSFALLLAVPGLPAIHSMLYTLRKQAKAQEQRINQALTPGLDLNGDLTQDFERGSPSSTAKSSPMTLVDVRLQGIEKQVALQRPTSDPQQSHPFAALQAFSFNANGPEGSTMDNQRMLGFSPSDALSQPLCSPCSPFGAMPMPVEPTEEQTMKPALQQGDVDLEKGVNVPTLSADQNTNHSSTFAAAAAATTLQPPPMRKSHSRLVAYVPAVLRRASAQVVSMIPRLSSAREDEAGKARLRYLRRSYYTLTAFYFAQSMAAWVVVALALAQAIAIYPAFRDGRPTPLGPTSLIIFEVVIALAGAFSMALISVKTFDQGVMDDASSSRNRNGTGSGSQGANHTMSAGAGTTSHLRQSRVSGIVSPIMTRVFSNRKSTIGGSGVGGATAATGIASPPTQRQPLSPIFANDMHRDDSLEGGAQGSTDYTSSRMRKSPSEAHFPQSSRQGSRREMLMRDLDGVWHPPRPRALLRRRSSWS